jgi:hypothetical protein
MNAETLQFAKEWTAKTEAILKNELQKHKIGVTGTLANSIKSQVDAKIGDTIEIAFQFARHGRFVDMGVGRGMPLGTRAQKTDYFDFRNDKGQLHKHTRKPKKWYSRPFYSRINSLNFAISASIQEQVIASLKEHLEK